MSVGVLIPSYTRFLASISERPCQLVCLAPLSTKVRYHVHYNRFNTVHRFAVALRNDHIRMYDLNLQGTKKFDPICSSLTVSYSVEFVSPVARVSTRHML